MHKTMIMKVISDYRKTGRVTVELVLCMTENTTENTTD